MVNTAEGAMNEITNMLQRMRELALQASNGTTSADDRRYLDKEYKNLVAEIERIVDNTEWNGRPILNGEANGGQNYPVGVSAVPANTVSFQVGMDAGATISVDFGDFRAGKQLASAHATSGYISMSATIAGLANSAAAAAATVSRSGVFGEFNEIKVYHAGASGGYYLNTSGAATTIAADTTASAQQLASAVMTHIDSALSAVSEQRSTFGAVTNQLTYAIDNLTNVSTNSQASRSRMMDTDYAKATSELARAQIIQQAGTAMLAQANQLPASVLDLIK
jgi:flagellin